MSETDLGLLGGLFAAAFLSATLLPMQSELALAGLLISSGIPDWVLIACASLANTLGAVVNWALGRCVVMFKERTWFPVRESALARAEASYRRYGIWSLLLSWVPFIGDPLTVAAGALRTPLLIFLPLVAIAKTGRYLALWMLLPSP